MTEQIIVYFLLAFIIVRDVILTKELQKLVDKLICRDYTEYASCQVDLERAKKKDKPQDVNKMYKI